MSRVFDREIIDHFFGESTGNKRKEMLKRKLLREFISCNLTNVQKKYIMLYYKNNMTITQIAQIFDVAPSTVSRTIKRARTRLYRALTGRELVSLFSNNGDKNEKTNSYK